MEPVVRRPRVLLATAVALTALLAGCSGGDDDPTPEASASSASPSPSPTPSAPVDEPADGPEAAAGAVLDRFLAAVAAADVAGAYALLSERSQAAVGDETAFAALGAELAEGFGAFAGGDIRRDVLPLRDGVVVVTLSGEVTREGQTETAAYAVPVRLDEGDGRLEIVPPRDPGAALLVSPDPTRPSQPLAPDAELAATVPAGSETYVGSLDGFDVMVDVQPAGTDRLRLVMTPQLAAGDHIVTFATVREDGTAIAVASAFTTA